MCAHDCCSTRAVQKASKPLSIILEVNVNSTLSDSIQRLLSFLTYLTHNLQLLYFEKASTRFTFKRDVVKLKSFCSNKILLTHSWEIISERDSDFKWNPNHQVIYVVHAEQCWILSWKFETLNSRHMNSFVVCTALTSSWKGYVKFLIALNKFIGILA